MQPLSKPWLSGTKLKSDDTSMIFTTHTKIIIIAGVNSDEASKVMYDQHLHFKKGSNVS